MPQTQFRSDDTSLWPYGYGSSADGAKTVSADETYDGANAGCSGTQGLTAITTDAASTFANGDLVLIHQSRGTAAGAWELNRIESGGGTTSLTMSLPLKNTYTDSGNSQAQILEMKQYSSLTINSTKTLSAPDWDGNKGGIVAYFVSGVATYAGNISLNAKGFVGGLRAGTTATVGKTGEGSAGASSTSASNNGNGGGGGNFGGADIGLSGAGGGNSAAASNGPVHIEFGGNNGPTASTGGALAGSSDLITALFGGGGGGGAHDLESGDPFTGTGGDGGGFALCIARQHVVTTGGMTAAGSNGEANSANHNGGGGGGAGGSILLKGQIITLGSGVITALKGTGEYGCGTQHSNLGSDGAEGRIHIDYGISYSGTTNPSVDVRQDLGLKDSSPGIFFL